jgi:hypothetical protein
MCILIRRGASSMEFGLRHLLTSQNTGELASALHACNGLFHEGKNYNDA